MGRYGYEFASWRRWAQGVPLLLRGLPAHPVCSEAKCWIGLLLLGLSLLFSACAGTHKAAMRGTHREDSSMSKYTTELPEAHGYRGDASRGEIEIVAPSEYHGALRTGVVFQDKYITVVRDPVRFPGGRIGTYLRIIEDSAVDGVAGVVIIPVVAGKTALINNFRHATRSWELELPRGMQESSSTPEEAARKELLEELGYKAAKIERVGEIYANTGLLASKVIIFRATIDGEATPVAEPEPGEAIMGVRYLTPERLSTLVRSGAIRDGLTLAALYLAAAADVADEGTSEPADNK